jgi:hypothetical protein
LGVDHQRGLVQPDELPPEALRCTLPVVGVRRFQHGSAQHERVICPPFPGAAHAGQRTQEIRTEQREPYGERRDHAEAEQSGEPADIAQTDLGMQEEAEETTVEHDQADGDAAWAEASYVNGRREQHDEPRERRDAVGPERDADCHRAEHRDREEQRRDDLRARSRVADDGAGHHRDYRRDQHRDDQQGVVAGLDHGRRTGVRWQLQRTGQLHEGVRQADSGPDPEYALQREPELGLPGIRTGELINAVADVGADRIRTRGEREDVVREAAEATGHPGQARAAYGFRHTLMIPPGRPARVNAPETCGLRLARTCGSRRATTTATATWAGCVGWPD